MAAKRENDVIAALLVSIQNGNTSAVRKHIADVKEAGKSDLLATINEDDETILHRAAKMRADYAMMSVLVDECPELLADSRPKSDLYRGQTALHIAITGTDVTIVDLLLQRAMKLNNGTFDIMINSKATGTRFGNTVLLGELPIIVAALTLNIEMFNCLVANGADLHVQNSYGDTIFHALIKYAYLYPDKGPSVMKMFKHVSDVTSASDNNTYHEHLNVPARKTAVLPKSSTNIWSLQNNDGWNPLKLAAKLGQHGLFKFIMELDDVYCFVNSEDGLFDVTLYDVTDIDSLSDYTLLDGIADELLKLIEPKYEETRNKSKKSSIPKRVPTLELIIDKEASVVFKFIELSPLRYVINRKWAFYRWFFTLWSLMHTLFMIGYTVYTIRRTEVLQDLTTAGTLSYKHKIGSDAYVTFYAVLALLVACIMLFQEIVRMIKGRMPWTWEHFRNPYHNGAFRLLLVIFAVATIADVVWRLADPYYGDYFLVLSMIVGWFFIVFFLRGIRPFSFFTVLIQEVITGDIFRFSIIITVELIAFTTGMLVAFRGSQATDENVLDFGLFLIFSFKMMFGFTSLDILSEAQHPWFAVALYISFVLLTYVLMINSLIAMMSITCADVSQNREMLYRVQQLSVILFFESIFPMKWIRIVGDQRETFMFDPKMNVCYKKKRLFMEVRSLHEVSAKSSHRVDTDTMLETIFHTIKSIQIPSLNVFDTTGGTPRIHAEAYTTEGSVPVSTGRVSLRRLPPLKQPPLSTEDASDFFKPANDVPPQVEERDVTDVTPKRRHKQKKRRHQTEEARETQTQAPDNVSHPFQPTDADDI